MRYLLAEWERNGYNDSDWYDCVYDSEKDKIETVEVGTTRFPGGPYQLRPKGGYTPLNGEVLERCREHLEDFIFRMNCSKERCAVLAPRKLKKGDRVRLLANHRNREKETIKVPCTKCGGTGVWVNFYRPEDRRECFGCKGTGEREKSRAKPGGKLVTYPIGSAGVVVWVGTFRTIYNGYNREDRHTLSTMVRLDSGEVINVPMEKLRLDREPMGDEELRERAREQSFDYSNFLWMGGCTAWGDCPAEDFAKLHGRGK